MTGDIDIVQSPHGTTIWRVPLPDNPDYPWRGSEAARYTVVIVNLEKFLACHSRNSDLAIPPFSQWAKRKIEAITDYMRPCAFDPPPDEALPAFVREAMLEIPDLGSVEMPIVDIDMRCSSGDSGLPWDRDAIRRSLGLPVVCFSNGRHRARFAEAMGARHIPVEVEITQAELMRRVFGQQ
jgi:hypothetical protein